MSKIRDRPARRPHRWWVRASPRAVLGGVGLGLGLLALFAFVGVPHVPVGATGGDTGDAGRAARLIMQEVMAGPVHAVPRGPACRQARTPC